MNSKEFLFKIYTEKKSRNTNYSIRAFARDLSIPSGRLTEIFNGKRNLTDKLGLRISGKLGLPTHDAISFLEAIRLEKRTKKKIHSGRNLTQMGYVPVNMIDIKDHDITSMTIAVDKTKIEVAKKKIAKFRRSLTKYLETGHKTEVYTFNVQLFPVSKA